MSVPLATGPLGREERTCEGAEVGGAGGGVEDGKEEICMSRGKNMYQRHEHSLN